MTLLLVHYCSVLEPFLIDTDNCRLGTSYKSCSFVDTQTSQFGLCQTRSNPCNRSTSRAKFLFAPKRFSVLFTSPVSGQNVMPYQCKCQEDRHRDQLDYLSNIVEWEPGKEDVSKKLCHTEDSIHHPVGQPLSIIIFGGTFNGLNPGKNKDMFGTSFTHTCKHCSVRTMNVHMDQAHISLSICSMYWCIQASIINWTDNTTLWMHRMNTQKSAC